MIALISGSKDLPVQLHNFFIKEKVLHCCVLLEDHLNQTLLQQLDDSKTPYFINKIGQLKPLFKFLKQHNVKQLVFAGSIDRKKINPLHFDSLGLKWLLKLGQSFFKGDDTLLKALIKLLENEQFEIKPASFYLKDLFLDTGDHAATKTSEKQIDNIQYGLQLLNALSPFDIGQSVIIDRKKVIGIEGPEGTEQLLKRCKDLLMPDSQAVLIKASKLTQTRLIDVPTIGFETFQQAYECGLKGVAIDTSVQVINQPLCVQTANQYNLFFHSLNNKEK